jgi:hypothetical protein
MVFFSFGWTPLQGLYPAEVLAYENRAKGLALQSWCTSAVSLINTFGMPIALREIGYISEYLQIPGYFQESSSSYQTTSSSPHSTF